MSVLIAIVVGFVSVLVVLEILDRRTQKYKISRLLKGPGTLYPLIGNAPFAASTNIGLSAMLSSKKEINEITLYFILVTAFRITRETALVYKHGFRVYFFNHLFVFLHNPEAYEVSLKHMLRCSSRIPYKYPVLYGLTQKRKQNQNKPNYFRTRHR